VRGRFFGEHVVVEPAEVSGPSSAAQANAPDPPLIRRGSVTPPLASAYPVIAHAGTVLGRTMWAHWAVTDEFGERCVPGAVGEGGDW